MNTWSEEEKARRAAACCGDIIMAVCMGCPAFDWAADIERRKARDLENNAG